MKSIVITGASRGIGRALAQIFLEQGDAVIGTSRSGTSELKHPRLAMIPLELADSASRAKAAERILKQAPSIDVLINNAGIWHQKDTTSEVDIAVLRETLEVNLLGPIDVVERLVGAVREGGHIINISSRRGSMAYTVESKYPDYSISKAGLNMYTRHLAARLSGRITVSCVHPGFVKTDMNEGEGDITPAEAAQDIAWLTESPIETGQFWFQRKAFPW